MPFLGDNGYVFAKIESAYGTDAVPTTTDLIPCFGPTYAVDASFVDRNPARDYRSTVSSVQTGVSPSLSFTIQLTGSGSSGVAPRWARLLRACGYTQGTEGGKAVFTPSASDGESVTLYYYIGTKKHCIKGARGSFSINAPSGGAATISFAFKGLYTPPSVVTEPTIVWPTEPLPPLVQDAQLSLEDHPDIVCSQFRFDSGNTVEAIPSVEATYGYRAVRITNREPSGSIDPEFFVEETFWTDYTDAVTSAFQVRVGSDLGNQVSMSGLSGQITRAGYEERDGLRTFGLSLDFRRGPAGNDEFKLLFD